MTRESTNVKLPTATRENYFRTKSRHREDQRRRNDEITVLLEKRSTRYVSEKAGGGSLFSDKLTGSEIT